MSPPPLPSLDHPHGRASRPSWATLGPLPPGATATVLEVLVERFPRIGRETWRRRFERGLVLDEAGQAVEAAAPVALHRRVAYFREVAHEPPWPAAISILHVDDRLVVADKPPFLPVVPGGPFVERCLLYLVEARLGIAGLHPVHRLDRATSGVVLLARDPAAAAAYGALFAAGAIERVYEALATVGDRPAVRRWEAASRLGPGEPFFRRREVPGPPDARTRIELLEPGDPEPGDRLSRFRLWPSTGKKHQLRIHMAALGFPILGDRFYPRLLPEAPDDPAAPLRLVAVRLAFVDPLAGRPRAFASGLRPETLAPLAAPAPGEAQDSGRDSSRW